jgi:putative ABC transport system ATP-binding protein
MTAIPSLAVTGLRVEFERWGQTVTAVGGLDLVVPQGQWIMLTGHNGSGKSSLLSAIAGRVRIAAGSIESTLHSSRDKGFASECFFVTQDPLAATADALSLTENLKVADPATANRGALYDSLMRSVGLWPRRDQLLRYFSGGERQQIALLVAEIRRPALLLLDEPFSALDPSRAASIMEFLKSIHRRGTTILQVTHDETMAQSFGDRTISLERGVLRSDNLRKADDGRPTIGRAINEV